MSGLQYPNNIIDQTFTILANILLNNIPTNNNSKNSFKHYRRGIITQSAGNYAEALNNYFEALCFEIDSFDRSYIFYNVRLIHILNDRFNRAIEYYFAFLDRNPTLIQSLNNVAVIYFNYGEKALDKDHFIISKLLFSRAIEYWKETIRLAPINYIFVQNWLKNRTNNLINK